MHTLRAAIECNPTTGLWSWSILQLDATRATLYWAILHESENPRANVEQATHDCAAVAEAHGLSVTCYEFAMNQEGTHA